MLREHIKTRNVRKGSTRKCCMLEEKKLENDRKMDDIGGINERASQVVTRWNLTELSFVQFHDDEFPFSGDRHLQWNLSQQLNARWPPSFQQERKNIKYLFL